MRSTVQSVIWWNRMDLSSSLILKMMPIMILIMRIMTRCTSRQSTNYTPADTKLLRPWIWKHRKICRKFLIKNLLSIRRWMKAPEFISSRVQWRLSTTKPVKSWQWSADVPRMNCSRPTLWTVDSRALNSREVPSNHWLSIHRHWRRAMMPIPHWQRLTWKLQRRALPRKSVRWVDRKWASVMRWKTVRMVVRTLCTILLHRKSDFLILKIWISQRSCSRITRSVPVLVVCIMERIRWRWQMHILPWKTMVSIGRQTVFPLFWMQAAMRSMRNRRVKRYTPVLHRIRWQIFWKAC